MALVLVHLLKRKFEMKNIYIGLTVAFLVACGGGGGAEALADVTDAMFNALVARVTKNENDIAALQPPPVETLADANGATVGTIVGRGTGNSVQVDIDVGALAYVATFTPAGSWQPLNTFHTEPTCSLSASLFVDRAEIVAGFGFAFSFNTDPSTWYSLTPVAGQVMPGWKREGFGGQCVAIVNPRAQFYVAQTVGASALFVAPFHIE
jgi:hypothetical protein